ncbi:unnamed protein product [Bursaphelenchus xylophilus]|uniref:Geranylgeranyl transferase type-1 subunit beta n=1 Tax=Bursaphelenchus xylophilus TaxID=6326 RepID=A0A1I7SX08_BURXY|nr:unnamed protein product [Bursaphelenchus xylophilus]CAG9100098.1 unnamed protein product [Bursaphelenchus xylophilus]
MDLDSVEPVINSTKNMCLTRSRPFLKQKHIKLLHHCLKILPNAYLSLDGSRPTLLFFCIGALDLLDQLDTISCEAKQEMINYLYRLQITSKNEVPPESYGFRGNIYSFLDPVSNSEVISEYESAHIAQTYSALCCLLILGDNLEQVDRTAALGALRQCQQTDGSFSAFSNQSESDMRFVFCAVSISYILNDFSFINVDLLCDFIQKSVSYDGGIGQGPQFESHGGSTYCAIASLCLLGRLWDYSVLSKAQLEKLKRWALQKQDVGFHGRPNKPDDSCYAFWIGATLWMLNAHHLVDEKALRRFLMDAQDDVIGGFAKYVDITSDILHTYFGIAALSIFGEPDLGPVFPPLNIPMRAFEHLCKLNRFQT